MALRRQASTGGWRAQINPKVNLEPMAATGTGHTVIDVRPAAAGGEAGEAACTRSRSPLVICLDRLLDLLAGIRLHQQGERQVSCDR